MATEFNIPKDGYLALDATTIKQFIKDRLNDNKVFSDQNYEGSYISTINEIVAYMFNMLLFYLNKTSTESMFSEAQLYDNMNRIVKLLDYKPIGKQTSTLTFGMSAQSALAPGLYNIPRYSYIENGPFSYSFNEDIAFSKYTTQAEALDSAVTQKLLYQGKYYEYPLYTAAGNDNELIYFNPGDNILVDHFNIDVYVKTVADGTWKQWKRVPTLYLEDGFSNSFEIRLNEQKRYEIKFGNDINGQKLQAGDLVSIYYLQSNGADGEVASNNLNNKRLSVYSTAVLREILSDLTASSATSFSYITNADARLVYFNNTVNSTYYQAEETVDSIRANAPGVFRSQYRLVTENDYQSYVQTNFANIIHDVYTANNTTYLTQQLKYYYEDVGLKNPNDVSNILYNQVNFADACNFNNVYLTIVPKTVSNTKNLTVNLTPAQKNLISSSMRAVKTLTAEVVILDPVYIAADICIPSSGSLTATTEDINSSQLTIVKKTDSRRDNSAIIQDVYDILFNFFDRSSRHLGDTLDINQITKDILSVDGVQTFYTQRTDDPSVKYNGLSMLVWNPIYTTDSQLTTKNLAMPYFKFMYLNNREDLINKIVVSSDIKLYQNIEF